MATACARRLGGSLASSVHGIARASLDADIVAALEPHHLGRFVPALGGRYYLPTGHLLRAVTNKGCCNLIHLDTAFKIDLFVPQGRAC